MTGPDSYVEAMRLRINSVVVGGRPVVALGGSLDLATVPTLYSALNAAIMDHPAAAICVDVQGVDALDDAALGVLLGAAGRARRGGGDVIVVTSDEGMRQRLALTGFDRAIEVVRSLS